MRRILVAFFFVASISVFACKEDESRPPPGGGAGNAVGVGTGAGGGGGGGRDGGGGNEGGSGLDSGGGNDSGDAGACHTLPNDGNVVEQNRLVGEPQTGTGGTIPDGTYELTAAELYVGAAGTPGPSGVTYRGVLRLTLGSLERVQEMTPNQGATPIESRTLGSLTAGGSTFTVLQTCPASFQDQYTYSVINNKLTITSMLTKESYTFTMR